MPSPRVEPPVPPRVRGPLPPVEVPPTAPYKPPPHSGSQPLPPVVVPPTSVVLDGKTLMLGGAGMLIAFAILIVAVVGSVGYLLSQMKTGQQANAEKPTANLNKSADPAPATVPAIGKPDPSAEKPSTIAATSIVPAPPIASTARTEEPTGTAPMGMLGLVSVRGGDKESTVPDIVGAWVVDKRHFATHALVPAMFEKQLGSKLQFSVKTADGKSFNVVRKIWHPKFEFERFWTEKATAEQAASRLAHAVVLLEVDSDLPPRFQLGDAAACAAAFSKKGTLSAPVLPIGMPEGNDKLPMRTYWPTLENPKDVAGKPGIANLQNCGNDRTIDGSPILDETGRVVAVAGVVVDPKTNEAKSFTALSADRIREVLAQAGN